MPFAVALAFAVVVLLPPAVAHASVPQPLPGHISGQVCDPVTPGIKVDVYTQTNGSWAVATTTVTTADGSFDIGGLPGWPNVYRVGFEPPTPDYSPTFWRYQGGWAAVDVGQPTIDLATDLHVDSGYQRYPVWCRLRGTATLSGVVRDKSTGSPVAGISIWLWGNGWNGTSGLMGSAVSAADGSYAFTTLPSGTFTIQETDLSKQYLSGWVGDVGFGPSVFPCAAQSTTTADFAVTPAVVFSGVVRRSRDGSRVGSVIVRAWKETSPGAGSYAIAGTQASTGADGSWSIGGLTTGRFKLQFTCASMNPTEIDAFYGNASDIDHATPIDAADGQHVSVDETLTTGGEVTGYCRDGFTGAVYTAETSTIYKLDEASGTWQQYEFSSSTLVGGAYDLKRLPTGKYRLEVAPGGLVRPGFYPDATTIDAAADIHVTAGQTTSVDTTVYPLETIKGTTTSAFSGRSLRGINVTLWSRDTTTGTWVPVGQQTSSSLGVPVGVDEFRYAFDGISPGTYRLTATDPNGAYYDLGYPSGHTVDDAADIVLTRGSRLTVPLQLNPILATISGTVRDAVSGAPIPGGLVGYEVYRGTTDIGPVVPSHYITAGPDGSYSFQYEQDQLAFRITDPAQTHTGLEYGRNWWARVNVSAGATMPLDFALQPFARCRMTVLDAQTGLPVPGLLVTWSTFTGASGSATSSADGVVTTPLLDATFNGGPGTSCLFRVSDPRGLYQPLNYNATYNGGAWVPLSPGQTLDLTASVTPNHYGTNLDLSNVSPLGAYGTLMTLTGKLTQTGGTALTGRFDVGLWRSTDASRTWECIGAAVETSVAGVYCASTPFTSDCLLKLRFAGDEFYGAADSGAYHLYPHPATSISTLSSGWVNQYVSFSLTTSDVAAPVGVSTYYALNDGLLTLYSLPVTVTAEGTTTVSYWSVDTAGNVEETNCARVLIDRTPPTTTSNAASTYWGTAAISLFASDALSGVAATHYRLDRGADTTGTTVCTSAPGAHLLEFWSVDKAGNVEMAHTSADFVVATAPGFTSPIVSSDPASTWGWRKVQLSGCDQHTVVFGDDENGFAGGDNGQIVVTHDAGRHWRALRVGSENFTSSSAPDSLHAWMGGTNGAIYVTNDGGTTWQHQDSGLTNTITGICFVSDAEGWATAGNGDLKHTADGGKTWTTISSWLDASQISFVDTQTGWCFADYRSGCGSILKTTDGGRHWTEQASFTDLYEIDQQQRASSLCFTDANNGWVCGGDGFAAFTHDGGLTWQKASVPGGIRDLRAIAALDGSTAVVANMYQQVFVTRDGGSTWNDAGSNLVFLNQVVGGFCFRPSGRLWFASNVGEISYSPDAGRTWQDQTPGTLRDIHGIAFSTDTTGWAASDGGLLCTDDGGQTWRRVQRGGFAAVTFVDPWHGWAATGGTIERTTDGGATWQSVSTGANGIHSVRFLDDFNGVACGYYSATYRTTDGGLTWQPGTIPAGDVFDITLADTSTAFAVYPSSSYIGGNIARSADGGIAWSGVSHPFTWWMYGIDFVTPAHGCAVGEFGKIDVTTDGQTWTETHSTVWTGAPDLHAIRFADDQTAWTVGTGGEILRTDDGGFTWAEQQQPCGGVGLLCIFAKDSSNAWVAGSGGTLLHTTTGGFPAPTTIVSGLPASWVNHDVSFSLATFPGDPRKLSTFYRLSPPGAVVESTVGLVSAEGTTSIEYWSEDASGNREPTNTAVVLIDSSPPTTRCDAPAGYVPLAHLSATDGESGVDSIRYVIDDGEPGASSGSTCAIPCSDGTHTLSFEAVDKVGNREPTKTATVLIDATPPVTTSDATPSYVGTATIHLSATDALSGVASTGFVLDGGVEVSGTVATAGLGSHTLTFASVDGAGNAEQTQTAHFSVEPPDHSSPSTTISGLPAVWSAHDVTFSLNASDADSPDGIVIRYTEDGGPTVPYVAPVTVSSAGTTTLRYWSVDAVGNAEATKTASVRIDKTPPAIYGSATTRPNAAGWYDTPVTVHFAAEDALSGVEAVTPDVVLSTDGAGQSVWGTATDVAGNSASTSVSRINIDTAPPKTSCDAIASYVGTATIHLAAKDGLSGVSVTRYSLDGGPARTGVVATMAAPGAHTLAFRSKDVAGNAEATKTVSFIVRDFPRICGSDRIATAIAVSQHAFPHGAPAAVIAYGYNYADALAAAPLARAYGGPVLLTSTASLAPSLTAELRRLAPARVFIAGSSSVVSNYVQTQLAELPTHPAITRFNGKSRFDTAAQIADAVKAKLGRVSTVVLVTGYDYHDGSIAAPLAAAKGWPILLGDRNTLSSYTTAELARLKPSSTLVVGDTTDISDSIAAKFPAPVRLGYTDHYANSAAVLDYAKTHGVRVGHVALAVGTNFPDALAAGSYLARDSGLLLLTPTTSLPSCISQRLTANRATITAVDVLGSIAAVSDSVVGQAEKALK